MKNDNWYYKPIKNEDGQTRLKAFTVCRRCGKEFTNKNVASSFYCDDCRAVVRAEQNRERNRRYREKNKVTVSVSNG